MKHYCATYWACCLYSHKIIFVILTKWYILHKVVILGKNMSQNDSLFTFSMPHRDGLFLLISEEHIVSGNDGQQYYPLYACNTFCSAFLHFSKVRHSYFHTNIVSFMFMIYRNIISHHHSYQPGECASRVSSQDHFTNTNYWN